MTNEDKPAQGYRHLVCGQVTLATESDQREDGDLFCVQCGRYCQGDDFLDANTHKELNHDRAENR